jgi:hypothetical protein
LIHSTQSCALSNLLTFNLPSVRFVNVYVFI